MNRIVFIERLDRITLLVAFVHRLLGRSVYYKELTPTFRKHDFVDRLRRYGLCPHNYLGRPGSLYTDYLDAHVAASNSCLQNTLKRHPLYERTRAMWPETSPDVIDHAMMASLFNDNHLAYGCSSVPLLLSLPGSNDGSTRIVVYPYTAAGCLLLESHFSARAEVRVSSCHVYVQGAWAITKRLFQRLAAKLRLGRKPTTDQASSDQKQRRRPVEATPPFAGKEVLFFPHVSLRYSSFFKKTYLFQYEGPGYGRGDTCVVWTQAGRDRLSERYMERYGIAYIAIPERTSISQALHLIRETVRTGGLRTLGNLFATVALVRFIVRVSVAKQFFAQFQDAKVAHVHYDALFPPHLTLAMELNGIHVAALQDRVFQYRYYPHLFYRTYFVENETTAAKMCRDAGYLAQKFIPIGVPRIDHVRCDRQHVRDRIMRLADGRRVVVCFGLFPISDDDVGIYGEDGTSAESNKEFLETVLDLAGRDPGFFYYLRLKDTDFIAQGFEPALVARLRATDNVFLDLNLRATGSYELLALADIVFGKLSMIIEEARAAGKPAFYYDPEGYVRGVDFVEDPDAVIAADRNKLFEMIQNPQSYAAAKQPQVRAGNDGYEAVRQTIMNFKPDGRGFSAATPTLSSSHSAKTEGDTIWTN